MFGKDELMQGVVEDSQHLRERIRSQLIEQEQIAEAVTALAVEIDLIIREDKRAA
jgi:chromosome condensin MukBEF ATPase and DNA-binding subunit MukB